MRMVRWGGSLVFFALVALTGAPLPHAQSAPVDGPSEAGTDSVKRSVRSQDRTAPADEHGADSPYAIATFDGVSGSVTGPNCVALGQMQTVFERQSVFRGNFFTVEEPVEITSFGFELAISTGSPVMVDLYFTLHEAAPGEQPLQRSAAFPENIVREVMISTLPTYYTTGTLDNPVRLEPGRQYLLGVAWANQFLIYGRNNAQTPGTTFPQFPQAQFDGSASLTLFASDMEPPVDPENEGLFTTPSGTGGPSSMEICLAGGCCLSSGGCANMLPDECLGAGGTFATPGFLCEDLVAEGLGCPMTTAACCGADETCANDNFFRCEEAGGEWHPEVDMCSDDLRVCIPKGACCVDDGVTGTCLNGVTEDECETAGGLYRGDDTNCASVSPPCNVGACCLFPTGCAISNPTACSDENETFIGFGIGCSPNPCGGAEATGACCVGTSCTELTESACDAAEGTFRGENTTCDNLAIACGRGACCEPTGCTNNLTESLCQILDGAYQGDGATCATLDPPCPGACCRITGCNDNIDPVSCTGLLDGVFGGYTECEDPDDPKSEDPCVGLPPVQACCLATGACTRTTMSICNQLGGSFTADTFCEDAGCEATGGLGGCCTSDGMCELLTQVQCEAGGGTFRGSGTSCNAQQQMMCKRGACCFGNGTCTEDMIQAECEEANGELMEDETCEMCPDGFACCVPDEFCVVFTAELCETVQGVVQLGTPTCDDPGIDCNRGACCDGTTCHFTTEENCINDIGGAYRGDDTTCFLNACKPGACCFDNGDCDDEMMDGIACDEAGGTLSVNLMCADEPCDPAGACCIDDDMGGTCLIQTQAACEEANGSYNGDGTACESGLCDVGACCQADGTCADETDGNDTRFRFQCDGPIDQFTAGMTCDDLGSACMERGACCRVQGNCEIRTPESCDLVLGTYRGDGQVCLADACTLGACCFDDEPCQDVDGIDCANMGGSFVPGGSCAVDACPPLGACCLPAPEGSCEEMTEDACLAASGTYTADDVACGEFTCSPFVCCALDGTCLTETTAFECEQIEGEFAPGFDTCSGVSCDVRGACCLDDGSCSTMTPTECSSAGGNYLGNGVACGESDCSVGACCGLDGVCLEDQTQGDCEADNGFFSRGMSCADAPACEALGACCVDGEACMLVSEDACNTEGGTHFAGEPCIADACLTGSCCALDGTCADDVLRIECALAEGSSDTMTECQMLSACDVRGACCLAHGCEILTEDDCLAMSGVYGGDEVGCHANPDPCGTSVVSSDPADGAVDARQPTDPDGLNPAGFTQVAMTFDRNVESLGVADFELTSTDGTAPGVMDVSATGDTATVVFDGPIPAGAWTEVACVPDGPSVCLGFLPGDANADRIVTPQDILAAMDALNGVTSLPEHRTDFNRNSALDANDIGRLLDLLGGIQFFEEWLGATLPDSPCE